MGPSFAAGLGGPSRAARATTGVKVRLPSPAHLCAYLARPLVRILTLVCACAQATRHRRRRHRYHRRRRRRRRRYRPRHRRRRRRRRRLTVAFSGAARTVCVPRGSRALCPERAVGPPSCPRALYRREGSCWCGRKLRGRSRSHVTCVACLFRCPPGMTIILKPLGGQYVGSLWTQMLILGVLETPNTCSES